MCGDGKVMPGEVCDDGGLGGCTSNCQAITPGYSCLPGSPTSPSVCTLSCGNSIIDPAETCDDGNIISGDGCSSSCSIETGYSCVN